MPTARNAKGIDIIAYNKEGTMNGSRSLRFSSIFSSIVNSVYNFRKDLHFVGFLLA